MGNYVLYDREGLNDLNVEELNTIATEKEIEGRSEMLKDDLVEAILLDQSEDLITATIAHAALGSPILSVALANQEARLRALESRLEALDSRTRPSTQILGS